jgi:hypothetical protein
LQKGATNLSDASTGVFIDAGKFGTTSGAGGGEVTSLQKAYDNSSTPEITTNTLLGAFSLKRGSAADTDAVFEVQNGAGTQVMAVTGQGNLTLSGTVDGRDVATDGTKLDGIASGAEVNAAAPTQAQAEDVTSTTEYTFTPERVKNVADVTPRNESALYTFTVAVGSFPSTANIPLYMAEQNETVDSVYVVPSHASSGSNGSNNWAIDIKKTGGTSMCSTVYDTFNTAELAALTPRTLGVDQNQTLGAEDVLYAVFTKTGTPTDFQHKTWTFVTKVRKTPAS